MSVSLHNNRSRVLFVSSYHKTAVSEKMLKSNRPRFPVLILILFLCHDVFVETVTSTEFSWAEYSRKIAGGKEEDLRTTKSPQELLSAVPKFQSDAQKFQKMCNIQNCSLVYRDVFIILENKYMSKTFIEAYTEYRKLRDDFILASFHHKHPHHAYPQAVLQRDPFFKSYSKHAMNNLWREARWLLFFRWLLETNEWKNKTVGNGKLKAFHDESRYQFTSSGADPHTSSGAAT